MEYVSLEQQQQGTNMEEKIQKLQEQVTYIYRHFNLSKLYSKEDRKEV